MLNDNARAYLAKKTKVAGKKIRTSDLFFWFPSDFFQISYVARDWDWSLNEALT